VASDVAGTWRGRLVDIRGFEGQISLHLQGEGGEVKGVAEAVIGATHVSEAYRIPVAGKARGDRLVLEGRAGGEQGVGFAIDARVFELPGGGSGLRGTYEVAARGFSPLRAGAIAASKGVKAPSTEVKATVRSVQG
jgi:hypothetical protein